MSKLLGRVCDHSQMVACKVAAMFGLILHLIIRNIFCKHYYWESLANHSIIINKQCFLDYDYLC